MGTSETTVTVSQTPVHMGVPGAHPPPQPPPYNQIFNTPATGYPPAGQGYPPPHPQQQPQVYPPQPYPQPGYPNYPHHQHQQQGSQVIITNPIVVQPGRTVVVAPNVGPTPTMIRCPQCQNNVVTKVDHEISGMTHCWAITLCLIGCWPFVCIPYCCPACQNSNHYCPQCGNYIGSHGMC